MHALGVLMGLFVAGGASCNQWVRQYTQPRVLPDAATKEQIVTMVNDNAARVQTLQSTQATLSFPGTPSLRANVALQSPRRLRLRGDGPLTGPEVDLGSNDELFWLWVKRGPQPATFVCRHDQFAMSSARQIIPIEPEWLLEAIGPPRIDTSVPLEGPFPVHGNRVELRSRKPTAVGELTKVIIVDQWEGTVVEQDVYNPQGQLLATARASRYKRDPTSGALLARSIDVQWPTAQNVVSLGRERLGGELDRAGEHGPVGEARLSRLSGRGPGGSEFAICGSGSQRGGSGCTGGYCAGCGFACARVRVCPHRVRRTGRYQGSTGQCASH